MHIHPFVDGNGRTSRLLSTLCLYRSGYDFKRLFSLSEFYDRNRPAFYSVIQGVREHAMDLTGWLDYFVEGLATQMDEVTERGKLVIRADVLAAKHRLNPRQRKLVLHLLAEPEVDLQGFLAICPGDPRRTLQRDLQQAVSNRVVVATGSTHQKRYSLNPKAL